MSLLVICEILRTFVNTLTVDDKYPFRNWKKLPSQFKCNYIKNEKRSLNFLFHFLNLHQILNILNNKMIVIDNVFPKLHTVKDLVRPLSKKRSFRILFDSQHVKGYQTLLKSSWEHFYHFFKSLWDELIWKMPLLVVFLVVGVFVNTLTGDDKYPLRNCETLQLPIQIQLSKKRKIFS